MRLRFSIRDLLWLTLVAALCVAWLLDHRQLKGNADELRTTLSDTSNELLRAKNDEQKLQRDLQTAQSEASRQRSQANQFRNQANQAKRALRDAQ
jgi:uncharacterized membrane-anchored protein YhcB (DUF1043 family)